MVLQAGRTDIWVLPPMVILEGTAGYPPVYPQGVTSKVPPMVVPLGVPPRGYTGSTLVGTSGVPPGYSGGTPGGVAFGPGVVVGPRL